METTDCHLRSGGGAGWGLAVAVAPACGAVELHVGTLAEAGPRVSGAWLPPRQPHDIGILIQIADTVFIVIAAIARVALGFHSNILLNACIITV